jgi:hypothetical protein
MERDNLMTVIETDSLYRILSDRAHWRDESERVNEAAEAADKEWRQELADYHGLRNALHVLLGLDVVALDDLQLIDALRIKLGTNGLKDGSALSSVDMPVRTLSFDGVDLTGYVTKVEFNGWRLPDRQEPPTPEDIAVFAAAVGGRAAAMVDGLETGHQTLDVAGIVDSAGAEQTAAMQPVGAPPLERRRFKLGDPIDLDRLPIALMTISGEIWDWNGHDDQGRPLYVNDELTEILPLGELLTRCTVLDEIWVRKTNTAEAAEVTENGADQ